MMERNGMACAKKLKIFFKFDRVLDGWMDDAQRTVDFKKQGGQEIGPSRSGKPAALHRSVMNVRFNRIPKFHKTKNPDAPKKINTRRPTWLAAVRNLSNRYLITELKTIWSRA